MEALKGLRQKSAAYPVRDNKVERRSFRVGGERKFKENTLSG